MKMTVMIHTIEIDDQELQRLQQDDFLLNTVCPRLVIPQGKIRPKRKTRRRKGVRASEFIGEVMNEINK
jgi:hypothetical protein